MKVCNCAMPAMNGNSDCCKGCSNNPNNELSGHYGTTANFIWTTPNIATESFLKQSVLENIKDQIDLLTIKEIKELYEYMKKFEPILK